MVCKNCGTQNGEGARFCSKCGADLSLQYTAQQNNQQQQQYQQPYAQQPYNQQPYNQQNPYTQQQPYVQNGYPNQYGYQPVKAPSQPGKGLAIASMACGITTLVLFCVWYFSIITGVLALVFGGIAKSKGNRSGMATAGIVCGAIGLALAIVFLVLFGLTFSELLYEIDPYYYY